jgi:hypothetical protein
MYRISQLLNLQANEFFVLVEYLSRPTKYSFIGIFRESPTPFRRTWLILLDLTDFNQHRWILITLMILILKTISLDCEAISKNKYVQYRFFCTLYLRIIFTSIFPVKRQTKVPCAK